MPISETETLLRERIDDLSTRLLIEGADQEEPGDGATAFVEALAALARQASDAGYGEAARVANELSAGGLSGFS